ncbi:MAG TPA: DNA polymerase IV [Mobilitalea sp.]|nr:DNA polymerase IV [Mobilitalea sp.]
MDKLIFHIDVNNAFLSWEAVHRLENGDEVDLRNIAAAVAGDRNKRHGIILAKSILAKQCGVKTGEPIVDALKKCPGLTLVPPSHELYRQNSEAFMKILSDYSPCVEKFSVDEAFCDMTGMEALLGTPLEAAAKIKEKIREELKFTVNIGISTNKLLAKMASDFKKPDMVHTLYPREIKEKMWVLPVGELFFVGASTVKKLNTLGIYTIGELARMDVEVLKAHLKKHGELIHDFANGIDASLISQEEVKNKGYGNSTTISFDVEDESTAKMILLTLAETVGARLRQDNVMANVISVSIVDYLFHNSSHQMTLLSPTQNTDDIHHSACTLFDELWDQTPIRNLGIQSTKVVADDTARQMNLFGFETDEKKAKLDKAIDQIRNRFGSSSIQRASIAKMNSQNKTNDIDKD